MNAYSGSVSEMKNRHLSICLNEFHGQSFLNALLRFGRSFSVCIKDGTYRYSITGIMALVRYVI